jgi:hypothetical protein
VGVVGVNGEGELEFAALVYAYRGNISKSIEVA